MTRETLDTEVGRIAQEKLHPYGCDLVVHRSEDRKSTRLNSSHLVISYAVFCLKKNMRSHNLFGRLIARNDSGAFRIAHHAVLHERHAYLTVRTTPDKLENHMNHYALITTVMLS